MKSTKQSPIINHQSSIIDIAQILQDNPILGAGAYPEAARLVANSSRLQRDLMRELEYYREDPDCDNVRIWHCVHQGKHNSLWTNRWGNNVMSCSKDKFHLIKIYSNLCPAMIKKARPAYYRITVHKKDLFLHLLMHVIISDIFIPNNDFTKTQRDHINGDCHDNNAFNLERVTPEENIRRRFYNYYIRQGRPVPAKFLPK